MRVFMDLEFNERGNQLPIQLISAAYVAEDGSELYVINEECLTNTMRDPWLSLNVAPSLPILLNQETPGGFITQWDVNHPDYGHVFSMDAIAQQIQDFYRRLMDDGKKIEQWAYYGAYDHVVHSQIFGRMVDLPVGFPMWTHDLMQEIERDPDTILPPEPSTAHHALLDARWNRDVFRILNGETTAAELAAEAAMAVGKPLAIQLEDLLN